MRCGYPIGKQLRYVRGAMLTYAPFANDNPLPGRDRMLCGWRVATALPLPDLIPWTGDDRAPDLVVDLGPVPERLPDLTVDRPLLQIAGDGTCRFAMPGVAAYLIDPAGTRVTIDPALPLDASDIRVFLLGTVFAVLCYRRGLLPLHASCVRIGNAAVALAGPSGIGKSTLAAAFVRRGHALLADDVTVVDAAAASGAWVRPAFPRLKLWRDAVERMGVPVDNLEPVRLGLAKFNLSFVDHFHAEPLPLRAVVHLQPRLQSGGDQGSALRLRGADSIISIRRNLYRARLMERLNLAAAMLPAMLSVTQTPKGAWRFEYEQTEDGLKTLIDGVLERIAV